MNNKYVIPDIKTALDNQSFPSVTAWNRLEARPRAHTFERALKAEVRDALWMLTRQWQLGEFRGDDAASVVTAKVHVSTTQLTHYKSAGSKSSESFLDNIPLEAQVECIPIAFTQSIDFQQAKPLKQKLALDLRLLMGRQWLKLLKTISSKDQDAYIEKYQIATPDPNNPDDLQICAHPEVWSHLAAVAGNLMDGAELFFYLEADTATTPHLATDGITLVDSGQKAAIDALGQVFRRWFKRLFFQPVSTGEEAWLPERLEYQFVVSAPEENGEKILCAEAYHHRPLDWYAFDVDSNSPRLLKADPTTGTDNLGQDTKSFVPTQVVFEGSPNTRWWTFENRRTNFGDIKPETSDLAKIMLLDFGLIYANDWFVVPYPLPAGVITQIKGMSVTNVFGERFWIEAAGSGVDNSWQRWSMFTMNTKGNMGEIADTSLLLLPTVPKIQESRPREQVAFIRDELSNMVWGIEKIITLPNGDSKPGAEAGGEILKLSKKHVDDFVKKLQTSEAALSGKTDRTVAETKELDEIHALLQKAAPPKFNAGIRYQVMNSVPEHWIPFIPVHIDNNNREIQLQRAAMPRIIEGDPNLPKKIRPRTSLLREGLDQEPRTAYYIHEEEVPRAGIQVSQSFQRARSQDGRAWVWLGMQKQIGRGEGSSGLAFDQLLPATQPNSSS